MIKCNIKTPDLFSVVSSNKRLIDETPWNLVGGTAISIDEGFLAHRTTLMELDLILNDSEDRLELDYVEETKCTLVLYLHTVLVRILEHLPLGYNI